MNRPIKKLSEQVADLENELDRRIATPSTLARCWEKAYFDLLNMVVNERMAMIQLTNPAMYEFLNSPVDALVAAEGVTR